MRNEPVRTALYTTACSPHEIVYRNEERTKPTSGGGEGTKVFMLGSKHAQLMAGLFSLASES